MKKAYRIENLDCANCAAKIENGIRKLNGVDSVSVSFFTQMLVIEADATLFNDIMQKVVKLCRKVEPDCRIVESITM